jgi:DNA-binding transcriptional regulator PaaX
MQNHWAVSASFYPVRAAYSYLKRLHYFGLLERDTSSRKRVLYRISEKGRNRLLWFGLKGR